MKDDAIALAKLRLEEILTFFGINTTVQVQEDGEQIELLVDVPRTGELIGHRGETLRALQHIINMIVRNQTDERVYVGVDIGGYKKSREETLTAWALEMAEKVKDSGEAQRLRPMSPAERRIVHMALAEVDGIVTESDGEGNKRRVVIKPS